jgi:uncharacterized protein YPO0396
MSLTQAVAYWKGRAEMAERRNLLNPEGTEHVAGLEARLERQQAVVERIKVMHRTSGLATVDYASGPYCLDCKQEWPCNTAAALTQAHPEKEPT